MARTDLLTLTVDDLAALSTRGKVKEARKDLDSNAVQGELKESAEGAVSVTWSDGRHSELPPQATLKSGRCSCGGIGVCKHLIRLVLLYQQWHAQPPVHNAPWDPGAIADDELSKHYRASVLDKCRRQFEAGILAELSRSVRPVANFSVPTCRVEFLVPHDLRYVRCDCAQVAPCNHVPLAVWAFRTLAPELNDGIVTSGSTASSPPEKLLDQIEQFTADLVQRGIAGSGRDTFDQLNRLIANCERAELVWPGEILAEMLQQLMSYRAHDARFDPGTCATLLGELLVRCRAIQRDTGAVPQLLIRGTNADRRLKLAFGEFWGLGTTIRETKNGVELLANLYDVNTASVVALTRHLADPEQRRDFGALGSHVALQGTSFHALGTSLLQLQSGRRSPSGALSVGRTGVAIASQNHFDWEKIKAPILVDDYAELDERLSFLPPSSLRPRRVVEDFHVLAVTELREARFDAASHTIQALLADAHGNVALLEHPYSTRGRSGAEALLERLPQPRGALRFVSGRVCRTMGSLVVRPACLVWEANRKRESLQPWIERGTSPNSGTSPQTIPPRSRDPILDYLQEVEQELGELLLLGISHSDELVCRRWSELVQRGESIGFARLIETMIGLSGSLSQRAHQLRWDDRPACQAMLDLLALLRLARDV